MKQPTAQPWRTHVLAFSAIAAMVWLFAARVFGPPDLYSEDQPRTVSYTVDMLVNDRWILPRERGEEGATKPPLYNWLAAPFVTTAGFSSELAHKAPTLIALLGCAAVLIALGRRLGGEHGRAIGWLAALALLANSTMFKIGYLARPDMLLCLWMLLGWGCATALMARHRAAGASSLHSGAVATDAFARLSGADRDGTAVGAEGRSAGTLALGFWLCVGLAALTKGPPALVLLVYALVASRVMLGTWRAAFIFRWWWGVPFSAAMFGAWIAGVAVVDTDHLVRQLWYEEFFGRVTGLGSEGNHHGPVEFLYRLFHMPIYFVMRFLPWSIFAILGIIALWTSASGQSEPRWRRLSPSLGFWLHGAAIMVLATLGLLSLSTGKRPLYIAPALAPGALLAAWWLLAAAPHVLRRWTPLAPLAAAIVLLAATIDHVRQTGAPRRDFGAEIDRFTRAADRALRDRAEPVVCWNAGSSYVQSLLGINQAENQQQLLEHLDAGETVLVLAGERSTDPVALPALLEELGRSAEARPLVQSARLPRERGWPGVMTLYEVTPASQ